MATYEDKKKEFTNSVIGKMVCIELNDDRKIYGQLICVDKQRNMVINDSITEVDIKYNTPINKDLKIYLRNDILAKKYLELPEEVINNSEKLEKFNELFRQNKFWSGNVIIADKHMRKIYVTKISIEQNE
ncbi:hypothetical protein ABPG72_022642 [Tetrahymena utriculariae]